MKSTLFIAIVFFASVSLLGCDRNAGTNKKDVSPNVQVADQTTPNTAGVNDESASGSQKAPEFTLVDTQGKKISLKNYRGKVVIIDFWATWCPPCRRGIPDLIDLQKQYKNKIAIIGVSLDTDTKDKVVPFMKNYGINYPVIYGTPELVSAYGNIEAIPTSFVIDKKGNIVNQHVGLTPKEVYISEIKKLLGKS